MIYSKSKNCSKKNLFKKKSRNETSLSKIILKKNTESTKESLDDFLFDKKS